MDYTYHYDSPLGGMTLASDGTALTGLWFNGQKYFACTLSADHKEKQLPIFDETAKWLDIYFSGKAPEFTPKLNLRSTPFRNAVWEILLAIPYGKTMTYGEIAKRAAEKKGIRQMSAQAIGGAVGRNPISLIIPCHRVVGTNGSLTGYAGGIDRKRKLLELEGADLQNKEYSFSATIHVDPESGGAYVVFPYDIRKEFGKGRVKVHAEFDGMPYDGSIVNMGAKDENGDICYVIGVLKSIRMKLGKSEGDSVDVRICKR